MAEITVDESWRQIRALIDQAEQAADVRRWTDAVEGWRTVLAHPCAHHQAEDAGDMATVVDKLLGASFEPPFELAAGRVELGASIGIAVVPDDGETVQELLRLADSRMHEAKLVARGRA